MKKTPQQEHIKVPKNDQIIPQRGKKMPTSEEFSILIRMHKMEVVHKCNAILDLYETGKYTLEECCLSEGVFLTVFKHWIRDDLDLEAMILKDIPLPMYCYPDLHVRFKTSTRINGKNYSEGLRQVARASLMKKVKGYVSREVSEKYAVDTNPTIFDEDGKPSPNPNFGNLIVESKTVKMKQEAPDTTAIMFALTNVDKENFKNRNQHSVDTSGYEEDFDDVSDDDLDQKLLDLQSKKIS